MEAQFYQVPYGRLFRLAGEVFARLDKWHFEDNEEERAAWYITRGREREIGNALKMDRNAWRDAGYYNEGWSYGPSPALGIEATINGTVNEPRQIRRAGFFSYVGAERVVELLEDRLMFHPLHVTMCAKCREHQAIPGLFSGIAGEYPQNVHRWDYWFCGACVVASKLLEEAV